MMFFVQKKLGQVAGSSNDFLHAWICFMVLIGRDKHEARTAIVVVVVVVVAVVVVGFVVVVVVVVVGIWNLEFSTRCRRQGCKAPGILWFFLTRPLIYDFWKGNAFVSNRGFVLRDFLTFHHGKSPWNHHFGNILSKHLKLIQEMDATLDKSTPWV